MSNLNPPIPPAIFRAYDIRGVVDQQLNADNVALISQAIGKCKCRIACTRDGDGIVQSPSCVCGFLDAPLFESVPKDEDEQPSK